MALTAAAKGNQALALLLTVATNLLGIVTVLSHYRLTAVMFHRCTWHEFMLAHAVQA